MKRLTLLAAITALAFGLASLAFAAEPIKIGALYNITGGFSSIDGPSMNGAKLAAKVINQSGGLLGGRMIEIIGVDTKSNQKDAAMGAKKLLSEKVVAGIGYSDPAYVLPSAPLFQKQGIPFVTSAATLPTLPKMIGNYMFMVPFGDDDQAYAIADYMMDTKGVKRFVVWTDNSMDFTKGMSRFFMDRVKAKGGQIIHEDFFMFGDKDFSAQITRLKSANADAVFVAATPSEAGLTTKQIRESGLTLPIVSGDGFDSELVVTVPGEKLAQDVYFSTHTYREDTRPEVLKFIKDYEAEYGRPPENAFAACGYDAVAFIADAVTRANSAKPSDIRDALAATTDFQGVTGKISYTRKSGVPVKGVSIISVHDGKYAVETVWYPEAD